MIGNKKAINWSFIIVFVNDIGPVKRVKKLYEFNAAKKVPCRTKFRWNQQVHLIEQVGATPCKYYISI